MKGFAYLWVAVVALGGVVVYMAHAYGRSAGEADPVSGITIPPAYRDWKLISDLIYRSILKMEEPS